ncbi:glycosyltransferase family 2 protein [Methanobrevibacter curvatus]|uniref:Undecaprenyl-phosphate mannosyltransferase n=1 Tax=Methanobrevibacter curvatus TaxID=49547 RepID=A0A166CCJ1_9EURY|nr:glycosyltransferase family 2 protein [Methanobrevibacter curvatus]KZX13147.1 undecaprenyl-phosphate mannosyltransferase [Methanobrevibacter curvatus]
MCHKVNQIMDGLFLVIPAFNESSRLGNLLEKLANKYNIVVVDDGSNDNTYEIAKSIKKKYPNNIFVCKHFLNRGVGAATKTGMADAIAHGAKYIITIDGDGQHDIKDIDNIVRPLTCGVADVVLGYRDFHIMPFSKKFANKMMNIVTRIFYNVNVRDSQSGFRGYKSDIIPLLKIHSDRYGAISEFTREIKTNNLKFEEVEIQTIYTDETQAKGTNFKVGLKIFFKMISDFLRGKY